MRKNIYLIVLIILSVAATTYWTSHHAQPKIHALEPTGTTLDAIPAPDFSFTTLDGKRKSLSDYKGKIVILHFWATWCAPCVEEFPKLAKRASIARDNIVVIALSSDSNGSAIAKFAGKFALPANFLIAQDNNRAITNDLYQTYTYPESIVINRQGAMVKKIAGDADWMSDDISALLQTLAATP